MTRIHYLRVFYAAVLIIALVGAGQAAAGWLDWWTPFAFVAVGAVELGGITLSVHADARRQVGERAVAARVLSAGVAVGAVAVNYFGHKDETGPAIFFAGMSALGYFTWLIDSSARRRDALRRLGKLGEPAPVYGLVRWARHPWLTRRARHLALITPSLGLYGSVAAAQAEVRAERRQRAIAVELRQMIAAAAGPTMATVAVNTFDMDEIAHRLAASADYDGLASRLAAQLTPAALAPEVSSPGQVSSAGQLAGVASATPERELITGPTGQEINDSDVFELAASLADRPHFPLPREVAEHTRTATTPETETVAPPTEGHRVPLFLADLMPAPTVALTTTVAGSREDLTGAARNGAHVTAIPSATLALVERPETSNGAGHGDGHLAGHRDPEMTASVTGETPPDGGQDAGHDAGQNGAEVTAIPPDSTRPDDGHDGGQNDRHDDPDPAATEPPSRAAKKLSANERKVAQALDRTPDATVADLAKRTRVSERTVRRIRAKLQAHADTSGIAS